MHEQAPPLHELIEQASNFLRDVGKANRGDLSHIRQRAEGLVNVLDREYPTFSHLVQIFAIFRGLAEGDEAWEKRREDAQKLLWQQETKPTRRKREVHSSSSRQADAWILDMFRATESAIPREVLVEDFIKRYENERHIGREKHKSGPWLFVFEAERDAEAGIMILPVTGVGLHKQAYEDRCAEFLPLWEKDIFLGYVFREGLDIDGWYAYSFGGSPLFDALLDIGKDMAGEPDYWINGVYLPGDGSHNARAVFVLYRNNGDTFYPEPPSGLRQDMRLLTVLALAWRQLEHQVRALARLSEADRRDMINLIAPGLLHHEIGVNMRTAYDQAYAQFYLLKEIAAKTGREDIKLAQDYSGSIADLVLGLYRITDAFNNLDKRTQVEDTDLHQIFDGLKLLLHNRLAAANIELRWNANVFQLEHIHTDVVLLTQSLLNLLNNAVNAMTEGNTPSPRQVEAYLETTDSSRLTLCLVNNGPGIPLVESDRIFSRGYTTRSQGHGQGLYLARLVSHYLGGDIQLMQQSELPVSDLHFQVGFRITISRHLSAVLGVAHNADR
jgi:signal transduction histidine kinase